MGWIRALFGRRGPDERHLHVLLRRRGASRSLRRFAEPFGSDAVSFWAALPRGTWALRSAARLGVTKGLLAAALVEVAEHARLRRDRPPVEDDEPAFPFGEPPGVLARPSALQGGVSESLLRRVGALGEAYAAERLPLEFFASELTQLLVALIDADPAVRSVREDIEEAQRWGRIDEVLRAMDAHDVAYAERHAAMAEVVRRHIRERDLVEALHGSSGHPYR